MLADITISQHMAFFSPQQSPRIFVETTYFQKKSSRIQKGKATYQEVNITSTKNKLKT